MNRDEAVAPVIAAMLILAIVVTFIAAWHAYMLPSMKAQAEMTHIGAVETGIVRFSSDIESAASMRQNLVLSEPLPLGGGDIMFDPAKSGGILRVQNESASYLKINVVNVTIPSSTNSSFRLVNVSYFPSGNFWQDQGYTWSYGYINVSRGRLATPLHYPMMQDVKYPITGALFDLTPAIAPSDPTACSAVTVHTVNMNSLAGHMMASGNGNTRLVMNNTIHRERIDNVTYLKVYVNPSLPMGFRNAMWNTVTQRSTDLLICRNVQLESRDDTTLAITLKISPLIPNLTVIHETNEIQVGALG
jgi:hypothetical protein